MKHETKIITPSGIVIKGCLTRVKNTDQTYSGAAGSVWAVGIEGKAFPSAAIYHWEDSVDVLQKARDGFQAASWDGFLDEVIEYCKQHGLIAAG